MNMKLPPIETSLTSLNAGLQLTGKALINNREWVGKFAEVQNQHQYPKQVKIKSKAAEYLLKSLATFRLNKEVCGLCLIQKDKLQMQNLCKCTHRYCYSCLNSYAITKVNDLVPVKCPQQECNEVMVLTSNVYRYLPVEVKMKYLQNKHAFTINRKDWQSKCQRCLNQKHKGQCKFSLAPSTIQGSFEYRTCQKCKVQIRLTSGKKKVTCSRCNQSMCYLCGKPWVDKHKCQQQKDIRQLQRQNGYHGCCECCCQCCSYGCDTTCVSCGDCCCRSCGDCCMADCCGDVLFSCDQCSGCCVLWNIIGIPVRILITLFAILAHLFFFSIWLTICSFWLIFCIIVSLFYESLVVICQTPCPVSILLILFYPITFLYGVAVVMSQTSQAPLSCLGQLCESFCSAIPDIWIKLSPSKCAY